MESKNLKHCESIANTLEAIAECLLYKCPNCGEYVRADLPACGCGCNVQLLSDDECEPWEQVSFYDYFENALDIDYIVNSNKQYKACRIMVACGGPNIYVNTWERKVELYWWSDSASYNLSYDVCEAIDNWAEECFICL